MERVAAERGQAILIDMNRDDDDDLPSFGSTIGRADEKGGPAHQLFNNNLDDSITIEIEN